MNDAASVLDDFITRVRAVSGLGRQVAPRVAEVIRAELTATMSAGQSPDGTPLTPRKKDGRPPLTNAAKALYVQAIDASVYVRLVGPEAAHHMGYVTGKITRQLIPVNTLPPAMAKRVVDAIQAEFSSMFSGGANG